MIGFHLLAIIVAVFAWVCTLANFPEEHNQILQIPIGLIGILGYLAMMFCNTMFSETPKRDIWRFAYLTLTSIATLFTVFHLIPTSFTHKLLCPLCVSCWIFTIIFFIHSIKQIWHPKTPRMIC